MKRTVLALALVAFAGCGDQQEQELKSAASWSATALAVARYWLQGDLPDASEPVNELIEAIGKRDQQAVRRLIADLESR